MSSHYTLQIPAGEDRVVHGDWHLPVQSLWPAPIVFFCHGFKGFKDWGPWPWFCQELAACGFAVLRFNFSFSGVGPGSLEHNEPEKFNRNTYGMEMEDLSVLWRESASWGVPAEALDHARGLALVGHSRGGLVSLLHASEVDHVSTIVSLASPGHSQRFDDQVLEKWRQDGFLEIVNARTGQQFALQLSVLDDFERQRERYHLPRALAVRSVPTLIVHGTNDQTVPLEEAHFLFDAIPHAQKDLVILPAAGHTFEAEHPFSAPNDALREVYAATTDWLRKHHGDERHEVSAPQTQEPS